ncbi:MAG: hypothetical protein B0A82_01560 [Alkalinema sp. CACIAM 70d]|nr:MAG: hypothetical protein B0A82_01560 [Alkalinema sp. CACIAM 70d]
MKGKNFRSKLTPQKLLPQKLLLQKSSSPLAQGLRPLEGRSGLGRRNFLGLGLIFSSSLLFSQLLQSLKPKNLEGVSFVPSGELLKPSSSAQGLLLHPAWSIGFYPAAPSTVRSFVLAKDLPMGDPQFLTLGAQLTIHRLYLPPSYPLQSLAVSIHYHPAHLAQLIKVCAWDYCANGLNSSPATQLVVPVDGKDGFSLSLDWRIEGAESASIVHQWRVGSEADRPKLQRGRYVIAGRRQSTGEFPQWRAYHATPNYEISDLSVLKNVDLRADDSSPIDFPYLLISVDYGEVTGEV